MVDEVGLSGLPAVFGEIDVSDLASHSPRDLILDPATLTAGTLAAGRAIRYARREAREAPYDAIGFRMFAASPRRGPSPLQTAAWTAMQRELADRSKADTVVDEILTQQAMLRPRAIRMPISDGSMRYGIDRAAIHMYTGRVNEAGREIDDRWTFSLTDLPDALLLGAYDADEALVAAQSLSVRLQATHWLPLTTLLDDGHFRRLQEVRSQLQRETRPGMFYCFLSHRWLGTTHPDAEGAQARFAAWQLVAHLVQAVRVAEQRGLHQPRRFSAQLGQPVGPRGTPLAEALIVNVLRFALDETSLRQAAVEVAWLEEALEDLGVARAATDDRLAGLRELLADRPILRRLTERIHLWYDYACLPQPPREGEDIPLFVQGLKELSAAQIMGRTVIMLDDAEDYLSRAWCALEALVADAYGNATDLVVGSRRPTTASGEVEHYFESLLADLPHVLWRAVLDTELFGIQTADRCVERLGLAVTDPGDLPFIYDRLKGLRAPVKIHIDDSAVVTGTLPMPAFEDGAIVLRPRRSGRAVRADAKPVPTASLDWTGALTLPTAWDASRDDAAAVLPFRRLEVAASADAVSCHVAVVGACEGEAILLAHWVHGHLAELEAVLPVTVTSISWIAADIAPVGHLVVGTLEGVPVAANAWVVVATSMRLLHCPVAGQVIEPLRWAGVTHVTVAVDETGDNVRVYEPEDPPKDVEVGELIEAVNLAKRPVRVHAGGLFQWQVLKEVP
ncbi:hypothetical protein [Variovorax sp. GT1P44]|uniref:hypothetical protein n=1 Tax=Variovorax sp. GT1P44 TaxID=3443742 RepID=UPI003F45B259